MSISTKPDLLLYLHDYGKSRDQTTPITVKMQISFDKFNKLTMGDQEFGRQLLEVYVGQFTEYIEEMDGYVKDHDLNKIRFLNHKIRSSVSVLEAAELLEEQVKMNTLAAREESPDKMKPVYHLVRQYSEQVVETLKQQLAKVAA